MTMTNSLTRRELIQRTAGVVGATGMAAMFPGFAVAVEATSHRTIPSVPGKLAVAWRRREKEGDGFRVVNETVYWNASETAIIICDMWADHPCKVAAMRVDRMAPKMNNVISLARDLGVAIIHAPSSGIKHYEETPYRARMMTAQEAKPPVPIQGWCHLNEEHEGPWPVVDNISRGEARVTGCDDPEAIPHHETDRHQHPAIKMIGYDGVSANGQEIYNFLEQEGRKNVVLMGVHTNMCVLGRPFGIRQQVYLGKNVVLCRDLTDGLYDPRDPPHVSHARGVELIIEHIEKYWCPSIEGDSLTKVVPGTADAAEG